MSGETTQWWVHTLDPVIIHLGGSFAIRWYGVAYLAAFFVSWLLLSTASRTQRLPLSKTQVEQLMTYAIIGVLAGGRLGYMLLYDFGDFLRNPLILFKVTQGGMSFHGGALGVILGLFIFSARQKVAARHVGDAVVMTVPFGLFFGRIANFINGELWGHISSVPWAVIFPMAPVENTAPLAYVAELGDYANPRHPSQLYEAALEGLVLALYLNWRYWGKKQPPPGQIAGEFLVGYAILRSICELFRVPDAELILGLSRGTFYSLLMLAAGVGVIVWSRAKARAEAGKA